MNRLPLFCGVDLAARIERAEVDLIATVGASTRSGRGGADSFVVKVGGGVACFVEDGSPFNKVAGLGFADVPTTTELDDIEQAFAARGAQVQVELSTLADPSIGTLLTGRGYRLVGFENVLGRSLTPEVDVTLPAGVQVRVSGPDEFDAWLDVVAEGVARPDTLGVPAHETFQRDTVERAERDLVAAGSTRYTALRDGVIAGGAGLRVSGGVAQLTGAATAAAHRRTGVHGALLAARLRDAAERCDVAVVTTQPGSTSQRNVQSRGFDLLYARAILVRTA